MTLYRRFALPVGTLACLFAAAMHLHTVVGYSTVSGADSGIGTALVSSLGVAIPTAALVGGFGLGWRSCGAVSTDDAEWIAVIALGALVGWGSGFVGVGALLSSLGYPVATPTGVDGLARTAAMLAATEAVPLAFASITGAAVGNLRHRHSIRDTDEESGRYYRSVGLPLAIVAFLFAVATWARSELATEATGQFVPWYLSVGYPLLYVALPLCAMGTAVAIGWVATTRAAVGTEYRLWFVSASVGAAVGWFTGSIGIEALTAGNVGIAALQYQVFLPMSVNVLSLIVAAVAGLSVGRLYDPSRTDTGDSAANTVRT